MWKQSKKALYGLIDDDDGDDDDEYLVDILGRCVRNRRLETLPNLRTPFLEEWKNIPQGAIPNCIASVSRMVQLIRTRGDNTPYYILDICFWLF